MLWNSFQDLMNRMAIDAIKTGEPQESLCDGRVVVCISEAAMLVSGEEFVSGHVLTTIDGDRVHFFRREVENEGSYPRGSMISYIGDSAEWLGHQ